MPKTDLIVIGLQNDYSPKGDLPLVGVELAAFTPANVVPGIGFSPDRMLQARLFSSGDAQRNRLGVNYMTIPVNAPRCPVHSFHRDGQMRVDGNAGSTIAYWPNSADEWRSEGQASPPLAVEGPADHYGHRLSHDHFEQPGALFHLLALDEQQRLFQNTARAILGAGPEIKQRHVANCMHADPIYGAGVAAAISAIEPAEPVPLAAIGT